jgi:hypothetical protein
MRHFTDVWSPTDILAHQFRAASVGKRWFMEGIPAGVRKIVAGQNEELLEKIVRRRNNLPAIDLDGLSYQIFKLGGPDAIKWGMKVFAKIIKERQVPDIWKRAQSVMLYRKGEMEDASNCLILSISCCLYRIFTALIAKFIQKTNRAYGRKISTAEQNGFIECCNVCREHSTFLNQLFPHTRRTRRDVISCQVGFSKAFGSVTQEMIYQNMTQLGLLVEIVREF